MLSSRAYSLDQDLDNGRLVAATSGAPNKTLTTAGVRILIDPICSQN